MHAWMQAAMAVPPRQPTAIHVQLPPDLPEDGPQSGRCLQDLISLREEWQLLSKRQLSSEQACCLCYCPCICLCFACSLAQHQMQCSTQALHTYVTACQELCDWV